MACSRLNFTFTFTIYELAYGHDVAVNMLMVIEGF